MKTPNDKLVSLYKKERNAKKKEKLLAMLHIQINGKTIAETAHIVCKVYNTVKAWYKQFVKNGPDGLDDKPRSGRPPKLKNHKLDEYLQEPGLVFPMTLAARIKDKEGVSYTQSGMRKILRARQYSPKVPMPVYVNRAPISEVKAWQEETEYWVSCLKKDRFMLYVMDQTTVILDHVDKRGPWSPVGERVYTAYHGKHHRVMVCGAFSTGAEPVFSLTDQFRTPEAFEFITDLARHRKVGVVMDKAGVHTSNKLKTFIEQNPHRIRVREFPTGWPELNASEFVWNTLKSQPFVHAEYSSIDQRIDSIENFLNTYKFNVNVEQHLFKTPIAKT